MNGLSSAARGATAGRAALVVAVVALVVSLGGTSWAADAMSAAKGVITGRQIKNGSVGSRDIRNNAIRSRDVRNGSLLAKDFKAGELMPGLAGPRGATGPMGPRGQQGPAGPQGPQGAPGVAPIAGATVNASGTVFASFNHAGGPIVVEHPDPGVYIVDIPGVNANKEKTVIVATGIGSNGAWVTTDTFGAVLLKVFTHAAGGGLADAPFSFSVLHTEP